MKVLNDFLQYLFPDTCLICGKEGPFLCLVHDRFVPAPVSRVPFKYLDECFAATSYAHDHTRVLVQALKFKKIKRVGPFMAPELLGCVPDDLFWQGKTIIPIPLHPRRQRQRGFNQAEVLARFLQDYDSELNFNFKDFTRIRYTSQQAKLDKKIRAQNLKGAFAWQGKNIPQEIILIDDVVASGHTLEEAAKELKRAGVEKVYGVVFARGGSI